MNFVCRELSVIYKLKKRTLYGDKDRLSVCRFILTLVSATKAFGSIS